MQPMSQQHAAVPEVHYRLRAPARGQMPGAHRSHSGEGGFEFRGHARLIDAPDPRRLDLLATLRDPFGDWRVRINSQRKAISVVVLADLSASMAFQGRHARPAVLADLVTSLGFSAWRNGDRFGFIGCDSQPLPAWTLLPTRQRAAGAALAEKLRTWQPGPQAGSASGLLQAAAMLGRQRALVLLVSDFHFDEALLRELLARLATHDCVPVQLCDPSEQAMPQRSGLLRVFDPESGQRRLLWWRPALRERWAQAWAQRQQLLAQAFSMHGLRPLRLDGAFDADAFTRHFAA